MARFPLYTFFYYGLAALYAPVGLVKGLWTRKYLSSFGERLGGPRPPAKKAFRIWLHALSLGEALSALPLIKALEAQGHEVVLSNTTLSGQAVFKQHQPHNFRFYPPYDFPGAVRRTLDAVKPDLFILVETDIWPNLLTGLKNRGGAVALVGARLSPRSFKGYRRLGSFWGRVLNLFDLIAAQSPEEAEQFQALGARPEVVMVAGSLKFEAPLPEIPAEEAAAHLLAETAWPSGPWIVAGSTHEGEEAALIQAWRVLRPEFPDLNLLLAPRDQGRFETVWPRLKEADPQARRRGRPEEGGPGGGLFLLDTLGELSRFYSLARVAYIGKSLGPAHEGGGHNPLEPAAWGRPVIFGPRMHNFKAMAKALVAEGGGFTVQEAGQLPELLRDFLARPEEADRRGQAARTFLGRHQGALARTLKALQPFLPPGIEP